MSKHLYRFTAEEISNGKGNSGPLTVDVDLYEDLFSIVEKIKEKNTFNENDAAVFAR